jgi:hypothetical protein
MGIVYLAYASTFSGIKVGYTTSSESKLKSRYKTYYGSECNVEIFNSDNHIQIENLFKAVFRNKNISNEIFDKSFIDEYRAFLNEKCKVPLQIEENAEHKDQDTEECGEHGEYTCGRCGYKTIYKWALIRHLEGKKECLPNKSNISCTDLLKRMHDNYNKTCQFFCKKCDKGFKTRQGLSKHKRKYCPKDEIPKDEQEPEPKTITLSSVIDELKLMRKDLDDKITYLQKEIN